MNWSSVSDTLFAFYHQWQDLAYVIVILLATLVVTLIIHLLLRKRYRSRSTHKHVWRDAILGALNAPLQGIVWMIGFSIAVESLTANGGFSVLAQVFPPARDVAVVALAAWLLVRIVKRAEKNLYARALRRGDEFDETASDAIGKLVRAVIVIAAILVMMQSLGYSIASLLAFGGVAGIAVGFAAQSLVANLLGGITVYASRPFKVGEYIIFPGTQLMGRVQHIGWRATKVLGFDRKPFYVPNAKFNTETIINHSRLTNRRIQEHVHIRYQDRDKVAAIVEACNRMLGEYPDIEHDFFVFNFDSYGDFALKLFLYAFTTSTTYGDYMHVKQELLLKIADIVKSEGAELALPVSTVYMPEGLALQREYATGAEEPAAAGLREQPKTG